MCETGTQVLRDSAFRQLWRAKMTNVAVERTGWTAGATDREELGADLNPPGRLRSRAIVK
jgi:hypothetical protein